MTTRLDVVTGAYSYTGKYITRRLLAQGRQVKTLTAHSERPNEFGAAVPALPYNFDRPDLLVQSLQGVDTLYNTFWVRFDHGAATFDWAVRSTKILVDTALQAGVRRLVHVSITNPSLDSPLPYFHGKAELEQYIQASGLSYAIIRPTVIYSLEDILINNIAYLLRTFPLFAIPGSGEYRLQPIYVEDMAQLAVAAGAASADQLFDAVGPEILSFNQLVAMIAAAIQRKPWIIHLSPTLVLPLSNLIGWWMKDVTLTPDEYAGLNAGLLVSSAPPTARTCLSTWLLENSGRLGTQYASELARHY
jgi:uncharacterized protein YbjT (DUF2867 family)